MGLFELDGESLFEGVVEDSVTGGVGEVARMMVSCSVSLEEWEER